MTSIKIAINKLLDKVGYKITKAESQGLVSSRAWINQKLEDYSPLIKGNVLDVGCGNITWVRDAYGAQCTMTSFDQTKHDNVDVVGDILTLSSHVPINNYDVVLAIEMMEHVSNPFHAVDEIYKVLKPGGLFISITPFMHEIHGEDYGDYWRITRQGWRKILSKFSAVEDISWLGSEYSPRQYAIVAKK